MGTGRKYTSTITPTDEAQALLSVPCQYCMDVARHGGAQGWHAEHCPHYTDDEPNPHEQLAGLQKRSDPIANMANASPEDLSSYWLEQFFEAAEELSRALGEADSQFDLSTRQPELFASRLVTRTSMAVEAVDVAALRERATSQVAAAVASLADTGAASLQELEEAVSLIHEEILREAVSQAASHVRRQLVSDIVRYLIPRLREPKGTR